MTALFLSFVLTVIFLVLNALRSQCFSMSWRKYKTLKDFGYAFNEAGQLRKIDLATGAAGTDPFQFEISFDSTENQEHYEALGKVVREYVHELLVKEGLFKIYIPEDVPQNEASFIFCSQKKFEKPKKLLILINGSGVVHAGEWSRSLIINHSINHGTQIPYIRKARELGYDIIVTNTNNNYFELNGIKKPILKNASPMAHALWVWNNFVVESDPESVAIVAHSYGGAISTAVADHYFSFFRKRVFAIGLTDAVHIVPHKFSQLFEFLQKVARNWVTSEELVGTKLNYSNYDVPRYSAGDTRHEWTSYACMSSLFEFFESRYKYFMEEKYKKVDL